MSIKCSWKKYGSFLLCFDKFPLTLQERYEMIGIIEKEFADIYVYSCKLFIILLSAFSVFNKHNKIM